MCNRDNLEGLTVEQIKVELMFAVDDVMSNYVTCKNTRDAPTTID